jgi:hypothetical protein
MTEASEEAGGGEVMEGAGEDTGLEVDVGESGEISDEEGAGSAEIEGVDDAERGEETGGNGREDEGQET